MITSVVAALRLLGSLERRHAVGDRLDAGQRRAARGERAQHQEDGEQPAGVRDLPQLVVRALGGDAVAERDLGERRRRASA